MLSAKSPLSLKKNFSWIIVGRLAYSVAQWLILILIVRLGSAAMLGRYSFALAITIPIFLFATLQLPTLLATDTNIEFKFNEYLQMTIGAAIVGVLITIAISLWVGGDWERSFIIMVLAINRAVENVNELYYGLFQKQQRMDRIGYALILHGILSLVFFTLSIFVYEELIVGVWSLVAVNSLILFFFNRPQAKVLLQDWKIKDIDSNWTKSHFQKLMLIAAPLAVVVFMDSLLYMIPRYFIEYYFGEDSLGIFTAFFSTLKIGSLLVLALGQAGSPRLSNYYSAGNFKAFRSLTIRLVGLSFIISVIGSIAVVLLGEYVIRILFDPQYVIYSTLLSLLMFRALFGYPAAVLRYVAIAARKIRQQPIILVVTIICDLVLCYLFIPVYGLIGAGYALIGLSIVLLVGYIWLVIFSSDKEKELKLTKV